MYRHARARELQRWKELDEEEREQLLDQDYKKQLEEYQTEEEKRTAQRRKKRQRQKEAKMRKKNLQLAGVTDAAADEQDVAQEEEFTYVSGHAEANEEDGKEETTSAEVAETAETSKLPFANDGSFLEQMKKRLAEETKQANEEGTDGVGTKRRAEEQVDEANDGTDEEGPPAKKQAL